MSNLTVHKLTPPATTEGLAPFVDARVQRLVKRMADEGLDAFITFSPANRRYLTGFDGSFGFVLIGSGGERRFFTDWRYVEQAAGQAPSYNVVRLQKNKDLLTPLAEALAELGAKKIGFEGDHVTDAWLADAKQRLREVEWVSVRRFVSVRF